MDYRTIRLIGPKKDVQEIMRSLGNYNPDSEIISVQLSPDILKILGSFPGVSWEYYFPESPNPVNLLQGEVRIKDIKEVLSLNYVAFCSLRPGDILTGPRITKLLEDWRKLRTTGMINNTWDHSYGQSPEMINRIITVIGCCMVENPWVMWLRKVSEYLESPDCGDLKFTEFLGRIY